MGLDRITNPTLDATATLRGAGTRFAQAAYESAKFVDTALRRRRHGGDRPG